MKQITKFDINPRFLFILDMYGATKRYIAIFNRYWIHPDLAIERLNTTHNFDVFVQQSFIWPKDEYSYWSVVSNQNEPEIKRLTKLIKN